MVLPVRRFYLNAEGGLDIVNYYGIEDAGPRGVDHTDWFAGAAARRIFPAG
jgi:hypothetical protein